MATTQTDTKVLIGEVRFSYVHVFKPEAVDGGSDAKYSVSLIIPKSNTELVEKIKNGIKIAFESGVAAKWGGKKPAPGTWKNPLRDGDVERPDDEAYAGAFFINATSRKQPGIVKAPKPFTPITNEDEFYSGCLGFASVNFFAFNTNGNKGVAAGLNNVLKTKDGDYLGGRASAESDFADVDVPDDMPEEIW